MKWSATLSYRENHDRIAAAAQDAGTRTCRFFLRLCAISLAKSALPPGKRRAIGQGEGIEMNFASDNGAGVAAPILEAILASSRVNAPAYGADAYSARAEAMLGEIFERPVKAFLTPTGTGANALALAALVRPWEAIFCHEESHVHDDECGAPEFFAGGAKLVGIPGLAGKITPEAFAETLARYPRGLVKSSQPGALSLSQVTEAGTVYSLAEIAALAAHGSRRRDRGPHGRRALRQCAG